MYLTDKNMMQRRDPIEQNFDGLEMQMWNIATDRAWRADEKTGSFCLVIMFTSGFLVIKMSKMAYFCIFWQQKVSHSLEKMFTCISNILFRSFKECYEVLDCELPLARFQYLKIQSFILFELFQQVFWYLTNGNSKAY